MHHPDMAARASSPGYLGYIAGAWQTLDILSIVIENESAVAVRVVVRAKAWRPLPLPKGFEGRCRPRAGQPSGYQGPIATGHVGTLLGTEKGKLFVNDALF